MTSSKSAPPAFSAELEKQIKENYLREGKQPILPLQANAKKPLIDIAWQQCTDYDSLVKAVEKYMIEYGQATANAGWIIGRHFVVFDVDDKNGAQGLASFEKLQEDYPEQDFILRTRTPSDGKGAGMHFYVSIPCGMLKDNESIQYEFPDLYPGIQILHGNRYCLIAGSQIDGVPYVAVSNQDTKLHKSLAKLIIYEGEVADDAEQQDDLVIAVAQAFAMPDEEIEERLLAIKDKANVKGDYDLWLRIGMCLKSDTVTKAMSTDRLTMWDKWSLTLDKTDYKKGGCQAKWKSFKRKSNAIVTMGTFKYITDGPLTKYRFDKGFKKLEAASSTDDLTTIVDELKVLVDKDTLKQAQLDSALKKRFEDLTGCKLRQPAVNDMLKVDAEELGSLDKAIIVEVKADCGLDIELVKEDKTKDSKFYQCINNLWYYKPESDMRNLIGTSSDRLTKRRGYKGSKSVADRQAYTLMQDGDDAIAYTAGDLNNNKDIVAMPDGTAIVLATGETVKCRREWYMTDIFEMNVDIEKPLDAFAKEFLNTISSGNQSVIDQLQRICGYALLGGNPEHIIAFLIGPGGTGKSTFADLLGRIVGEHYVGALAAVDYIKNNSTPHTASLEHLVGKKVLLSPDISEGVIDGDKGKNISSGMLLNLSKKHKEIQKLIIDGVPFLQLNEALQYTASDGEAFDRRVLVVKFENVFEENLKFKAELEKSIECLIAWGMRGCREYIRLYEQGIGLRDQCPIMLQWTTDYIEENGMKREKGDKMAKLYNEMFDEAEAMGATHCHAEHMARAADEKTGGKAIKQARMRLKLVQVERKWTNEVNGKGEKTSCEHNCLYARIQWLISEGHSTAKDKEILYSPSEAEAISEMFDDKLSPKEIEAKRQANDL